MRNILGSNKSFFLFLQNNYVLKICPRLIPDHMDTTVHHALAAYDRIIFCGSDLMKTVVPNSAKTYRYNEDAEFKPIKQGKIVYRYTMKYWESSINIVASKFSTKFRHTSLKRFISSDIFFPIYVRHSLFVIDIRHFDTRSNLTWTNRDGYRGLNVISIPLNNMIMFQSDFKNLLMHHLLQIANMRMSLSACHTNSKMIKLSCFYAKFYPSLLWILMLRISIQKRCSKGQMLFCE